MDRFSKLNPRVDLLFFLLVLVAGLICFNPIFLFVFLFSAILYNVKLQGKKALLLLKYIVPLIVFVAVFNMTFVSYGKTVLFELFNKAFTVEGLFYGFCQGLMLSGVITWISNYSIVMQSDKMLSVFSRLAPKISLTLSMVFAFIPRLKHNAEEINDARKNIDKDKSKLKKSLDSFSALVSITLEESIELADSMNSRGFNNNRTAYSKYAFSIKDGAVVLVEILLVSGLIANSILKLNVFVFEPAISLYKFNLLPFLLHVVLCFLPLIIDFTEDMRWLILKSKI